MLDDIVLGTSGHIQILRLTQHPIGSREGPEDAGIQNRALVGIGMQHILIINATVEATVLLVLHLVDPEAQDVVFQHLAHLLFQCFNCCHY